MPDLILNWGAFGAYGTPIEGGETVDTGGVDVTIGFTAEDEGANAITFNAPGYVADDEDFSDQSYLKLDGQGGEGGIDDTSTTTIDFSSSNALYADTVENVTFRLNDIDGGGDDIDPGSADHKDIVSIIAYGPDGQEIPVQFVPNSDVDANGNTLTGGESNYGYADGEASTLVSIAGPVSYIEIQYDNAAAGEQTVMVSDLHFSTMDAIDENLAPTANDDMIECDGDTSYVLDVLANDTDPEGDALTITSVDDPANGSVTINGDGTLTYTPDAGFDGDETFDYTITDTAGNSSTATVTVCVTPGNTAPTANDDDDTTDSDSSVVVNVLANDTDPDSDPLTVTGTTTPANGEVVVNGDGTVTYTPDADFVGTDTFDYTVSDGNGGTSTATVTVVVTEPEPNDPATPADDSATTPVDQAVVIAVLDNDTDPEGDDLSVIDASEPTNGSIVVNPDGTITYTPDAGFEGTDTFEYTVEDEGGNFSSAIVTVTVGDPNEAPTAVDDSDTTEEGEPVVITVLGNDTDPEGDELTVTSVETPNNGTAVINADGTITYTPNAGFTGTELFDYTITDEAGNTSTAEITVVVTEDPNTAPVAADDAETTDVDEAVVISVLDNDSDPDSDPLTVTGATDPANGSVVVNGDGTITYTPDAGYIGTDTFDYTITDGNGGTATATVTVVVEDPNTAPVAVADTATTDEGELVVIPVLTNDSDPDGDPLTVTDATDPINGSVVVNGDGTITYTPNAGFFGTDTFDYTITDGNGGTSTATVTVTVDEDDDEPRIDADVFPVDPSLQPLDPLDGLDEDPDPTDDLDVEVGTDGADTFSTGDDADTITAGAGDDTIDSGIDDDWVDAGDGDDLINDVQGADFIIGGAGDDSIYVGTNTFSDYEGDDSNFGPGTFLTDTLGFTSDGNTTDGLDTVFGGLGNDVIFTGDDADEIDGGEGNDTIDAGIDDDTVIGGMGDDSILGDHGSDSILGNEGNDYIDAGNVSLGGDEVDAIDAVPENDLDFVDGGAGNDTILGGDDDDTLLGGDGDDSLDGGIDDDSLVGGNGSDTGLGGQGNDVIDLSGFTPEFDDEDFDPTNDLDYADGGAGDDTITTGDDDDTIIGGAGNDLIDAGIDEDSVIGGDGSDTVLAGQGDDFVDTSGGTPLTDDVDPDPENDRDSVDGAEGNDTIITGDDDDTITSGMGDDLIDAGIDDDVITSGTGSDTVDAGQGDDIIDTQGFPFDDAPDSEDLDPENDRDSVIAGAGNDIITTGDDRDTIDAGDGNDTVDAGIDDDLVDGGAGDDVIDAGQGNDTVTGGDGADTVDGGVGEDVIDTSGGTPLTDDVDPDPEDDRDSVIGGAGNDIITTGDDDDTIDGGADNDIIDAGIDDDLVFGGTGNDTIDGGEGDDTIDGEEGDDSIIGGDGCDVVDGGDGADFIDTSGPNPILDATDPNPLDDCDSVEGGAGADTIITGDDADTIRGGAGDDVIDAGIDNDDIEGGTGDDSITAGEGDDTVIGAAGNDTLIGGEGDDLMDGVIGDDVFSGGGGADTMSGGQGQDLFTDITAGDVVDGGSGPGGVRPNPDFDPALPVDPVTNPEFVPNDWDTLDLTGAAEAVNPGGSLTVVYTSDDREDGFVEFRDEDGNITSTMEFEEIENVVPCFTPGTAIATPRGERLVEDLKVGDKIITRDNGIQEIRWMGTKALSGFDLARSPNLRPILIQKGSLGNNLPEHDILVSPQHRILLNNERTSLYFEETEVLAAAKHLTDLPGVDEVGTLGVTYVHFMFDNHEVVLSNGAWTESFQPGQSVIDGLGTEQRDEIFQLFPELQTEEGVKDYAAARRALKKHEAKLLVR